MAIRHPSAVLVVPAFAKVNLALELAGRRSDGWHELDSVTVTIDWHDLLGLELKASGGGRYVHLDCSGDLGDLPPPQQNLVFRAAESLLAQVPAPAELHLWLYKAVPVGAGLGGGSADAAALLRAAGGLLSMRGRGLTPAALAELGTTLGSDIPALLEGGSTRVRGRGENVNRLRPIPALHLAVAVLGRVSTAAAYAATSPQDFAAPGRCQRLQDELERGAWPDPGSLGSALEAAACRTSPELEGNLTRLRRESEHDWHLTGSGGAAFSLHKSPAAAKLAAADAVKLGFPVRVCRTVPSVAP